uniref:Major facilitator superfamily (MFS) profile domain-containing protein n=1 Tax=Octopus bimaculoides TaxID=37653 RepID=A0A0L8HAN9_OCTBM
MYRDAVRNFAPYIVSYMRDRKVAPDLQYNESIWIFAMVLLGQGTTGFLGGMLERLIGPRLTTLAGAWIMSSGVLLTYFSVNHSFASCLITYGLIFGFGVGLAYPIPTGCAMRWMPHRKGFVVGFVVAGYGGGAFIFNQVITGFINPRNLSPDIDHNGEQVKQELRRSQRLKVEWRITATRWKWKQLKVLQRPL